MRVYIYMPTSIYTYIDVQIYIYIYIYTYICVCTNKYLCIYIHINDVYAYLCKCTNIFTRVCIGNAAETKIGFMHAYIRINTYVCVSCIYIHICMYIHMYRTRYRVQLLTSCFVCMCVHVHERCVPACVRARVCVCRTHTYLS